MKRVLVFLSALLLAQAALAQPWYAHVAGASIKTKATADRASNDAALTAAGFNVIGSRESSGETAFKLAAGYTISRTWAIEAGYVDFGQMHHYSGTFTTGANNGNQVKDWDGSGWFLSVIGKYPLPANFAAFAIGSVYRIEGEFRTATLITTPAGAVVSRTEEKANGSGTVPALGIGVMYTPAPELDVRLSYERLGDKSGLFGAANDLKNVQLFSLGATYRF